MKSATTQRKISRAHLVHRHRDFAPDVSATQFVVGQLIKDGLSVQVRIDGKEYPGNIVLLRFTGENWLFAKVAVFMAEGDAVLFNVKIHQSGRVTVLPEEKAE